MTHRTMRWFSYQHEAPELQAISREFYSLAVFICQTTNPGPEQSAAMRKLLEARDCAIRAALETTTQRQTDE